MRREQGVDGTTILTSPPEPDKYTDRIILNYALAGGIVDSIAANGVVKDGRTCTAHFQLTFNSSWAAYGPAMIFIPALARPLRIWETCLFTVSGVQYSVFCNLDGTVQPRVNIPGGVLLLGLVTYPAAYN